MCARERRREGSTSRLNPIMRPNHPAGRQRVRAGCHTQVLGAAAAAVLCWCRVVDNEELAYVITRAREVSECDHCQSVEQPVSQATTTTTKSERGVCVRGALSRAQTNTN